MFVAFLCGPTLIILSGIMVTRSASAFTMSITLIMICNESQKLLQFGLEKLWIQIRWEWDEDVEKYHTWAGHLHKYEQVIFININSYTGEDFPCKGPWLQLPYLDVILFSFFFGDGDNITWNVNVFNESLNEKYHHVHVTGIRLF